MRIILIIFLSICLLIAAAQVYAQQTADNQSGSDEVQVMDANSYKLSQMQELIKNALKSNGSVNSDYFKIVMEGDFLSSNMTETPKGYVFTTGANGLAEGEVKQGTYETFMGSLPEVDIKVQPIVTIGSNEAVVPIYLSKGTGKVEKLSRQDQKRSSGIVLAQEESKKKLTKVTIAIFSDENGNGKIDENEKVLPLGGLAIALKKADQEKKFHLLSGWNLITLTALPNTPITAASLIEEIGRQGGEAVSVSTLENGAWKSFVSRGDKDYSLNDFPIEVGKAYFVKALKKADFSFTGQEFVSPVKLSLKSGWNAVGFPQTAKQYQAKEIIDNLNSKQAGADLISAFKSGLWDTFVEKDRQSYGNNFLIFNNKGYILRVGQETEWSP